MNWNTTIEQHREALQRIVALLFALAILADRAGCRSRRVRREVLSILSPAEIAARDLIIEEAQACGMPILDLPAFDGRGGDATQRAARLRALAAVLAYVWAHLSPAKRRSPHYFLFSGGLPQAPCEILRSRRDVGFRALDSPLRCVG